MRLLFAAAYYAASIPRLLTGMRHPFGICAIFLGGARFPTEVELRRSGLRFKIRDSMDLWILKETCLDDAYFPKWLRPEPRWRVVDIGGSIGDFAVMAGARCPDGIVHVYEPLAASFALLQKNLALNGSTNVVARQAAVAAHDGELALLSHDERPAAQAQFVTVTGREGEIRVPARGLASVLDALPGAECDFMKIDCEGGEFNLLLNSDPALLRCIHRISLEYHEGFAEARGSDIASHLESHGFRVWSQRNPVQRHLGQLYAQRAGVRVNDSGSFRAVSLGHAAG